MGALNLHRLTKRYRQILALDDVSLDVADGEFLVLLGPSGSGKSTILKLIAGMEIPDAGEIWLDGARIDKLLPRYRHVAMVFQSYALYPHMSVAKNLAFPLESAGVKRGTIRERVDEVARMLELEPLLKRKPSQLSGGQQQRVALGRAIVRRPKLFLLDEPLSNLDAQLRTKTRLELVALHERLRGTTVYVTHDQTEAMTMGHRVAVIDNGRLHQVGSPEVVYEYPANLVVAKFLGSPPMNLLPVCLQQEGTTLHVHGNGFRFELPGVDTRQSTAVGAEDVILGIRAEYLFPDIEPGRMPSFQAQVVRVELLGHERLAYMRIGNDTVAVWTPRRWTKQPGDRVRVGIEIGGVRLFNGSTGIAITAGDT